MRKKERDKRTDRKMRKRVAERNRCRERNNEIKGGRENFLRKQYYLKKSCLLL